MALDVPAVLQTQGFELLVAELSGQMTLQLVAELGSALANEVAIELVVSIHLGGS
jgi:hypothetical protein